MFVVDGEERAQGRRSGTWAAEAVYFGALSKHQRKGAVPRVAYGGKGFGRHKKGYNKERQPPYSREMEPHHTTTPPPHTARSVGKKGS